MGQIANDVLIGFICQYCLAFIDGDNLGQPRSCSDCEERDE